MRSGSIPTLRCYAARSSHETALVWESQSGNHHKSVWRCTAKRPSGRQWVSSPSKTSATFVSPFEPVPGGVLSDSPRRAAIASHSGSLPMCRWGATLAHSASALQAQSGAIEKSVRAPRIWSGRTEPRQIARQRAGRPRDGGFPSSTVTSGLSAVAGNNSGALSPSSRGPGTGFEEING